LTEAPCLWQPTHPTRKPDLMRKTMYLGSRLELLFEARLFNTTAQEKQLASIEFFATINLLD